MSLKLHKNLCATQLTIMSPESKDELGTRDITTTLREGMNNIPQE